MPGKSKRFARKGLEEVTLGLITLVIYGKLYDDKIRFFFSVTKEVPREADYTEFLRRTAHTGLDQFHFFIR